MGIQDRPRCFGCAEIVEYEPIYAAPCDHDECLSAVWHGLCLMEWREHVEKIKETLRRWRQEH